jgi:hypothetical protein
VRRFDVLISINASKVIIVEFARPGKGCAVSACTASERKNKGLKLHNLGSVARALKIRALSNSNLLKSAARMGVRANKET